MPYLRFSSLIVALFLAACACPHTGNYGGSPYEGAENENVRTAGTGAGENNFYCLNKVLPDWL